mmetsp:Transcript_142813/g.456348  ORF Transcript_142813/g.456348 Transcript_142813/m.456348 type:complete len:204 (-) Transcript_142813:582-1193(-)
MDAGIGTVLADELLAGGALGLGRGLPGPGRLRGTGHAGEVGVRHHRCGVGSLGLHLLQHLQSVVLAVLAHWRSDLDFLLPDVVLVPEREAAGHESVHQNAQRPDVHFHAVGLVQELRRPKLPRAALRRERLRGIVVRCRAEIRENNHAPRVQQVLAIHHEIVAFDVAMRHTVDMQVVERCSKLVSDVCDLLAGERSTSLQTVN